VRNPNYWNAPRPYVDQVFIKAIADTSQRLNTLRASGTPGVAFINTVSDAQQAVKQGGLTTNVLSVNGARDSITSPCQGSGVIP